jgi:ATP phosphoribosyltransferase regulatory subunit
VARIDAHLLNRRGVVRLAYCGPVVHTRPGGPWSTREPLQFGAEIYGHAGLEADLEAIELAIDGLRQAGVRELVLDLGDARIAAALLDHLALQGEDRVAALEALAAKDAAGLPAELQALVRLFGPASVLDEAADVLPALEPIRRALADLRWIIGHVSPTHPDVRIGVDLADLGGQDYYSGVRFSLMAAGSVQALASGGRYDHVGRVFGRERPAVGFSLDIKRLAQALVHADGAQSPRPAVRAPWSEDASLRAAIRELRAGGETVVCILPGHEQEAQEFACDRELVPVAGRWVLQALSN